MTREEAIHELKMCKAIIEQSGHDYLDERDIPLIDMAISALSAEEADGCLGCEYEGLSEFDEPCTDCKNNYLNKWTTKKTEPSDLISRAEAKKAICKACLNGESIMRCKHKWNCPYLMELYEVPSVSAERVGVWQVSENMSENHIENIYQCSNCGFEAWGETEKYNYCPNCGARMENTK